MTVDESARNRISATVSLPEPATVTTSASEVTGPKSAWRSGSTRVNLTRRPTRSIWRGGSTHTYLALGPRNGSGSAGVSGGSDDDASGSAGASGGSDDDACGSARTVGVGAHGGGPGAGTSLEPKAPSTEADPVGPSWTGSTSIGPRDSSPAGASAGAGSAGSVVGGRPQVSFQLSGRLGGGWASGSAFGRRAGSRRDVSSTQPSSSKARGGKRESIAPRTPRRIRDARSRP